MVEFSIMFILVNLVFGYFLPLLSAILVLRYKNKYDWSSTKPDLLAKISVFIPILNWIIVTIFLIEQLFKIIDKIVVDIKKNGEYSITKKVSKKIEDKESKFRH